MPKAPEKRETFTLEVDKILTVVRVIEHQRQLPESFRHEVNAHLKLAAQLLLAGPAEAANG